MFERVMFKNVLFEEGFVKVTAVGDDGGVAMDVNMH